MLSFRTALGSTMPAALSGEAGNAEACEVHSNATETVHRYPRLQRIPDYP